jgi:teichuronic acid biosynthesis glycosyltransferase TuaH
LEEDGGIIWVSNAIWEDHSADHNIVTELARRTPVLWVDAPSSPATPGRFGAPRVTHPRLRQAAPNVTRLTPMALPGLTRPGVRITTLPLVTAQIRWAAHRTRFHPHAVVATSFEGVPTRRIRGARTVLYATDDYIAGAELIRLPAGWLKKQERRALAAADRVAAVSTPLAGQLKTVRPVAVIPNGCTPSIHTGPVPEQALALPRPVVALSGRLNPRIDISVLEAVADAGFSLLLAGPHDSRWEPARFRRLVHGNPRVHHTGWVPPGDMPAWLAAADIGITPYLDTPFNRASFPVKTLGYLAAGLPAVTSPLAATRWLLDGMGDRAYPARPPILATADTPSGFVKTIRVFLENAPRAEHATRSQVCRLFAARHTWERRAAALAALAAGGPPP